MATRSQKRKVQREVPEKVNPGLVFPIVVEGIEIGELEVIAAGPFRPNSPRMEKSELERIRTGNKDSKGENNIRIEISNNPIPTGTTQAGEQRKHTRHCRNN